MDSTFRAMDAPAFFTAKAQRRIGVELRGSPNFLHVFGEILTTAFEYVDLSQDIRRTTKYLPLKTVVITNHSSQDVDIEINGIFYAAIPAGVIETITQSIWVLRATNNDSGTVAAGLLTANFKTPALGADEAARLNFARRISGR